ncbi:hypothetical protein FSARC_1866 [Fusarium sarcochroum]|uniref:Uncharacterized protein n=1 Tax=Fusarium sarcochroum TaxID=1208366 RepID=A0A8H4U826_9HYPO|nr:hypothetical protein FSARC_1866 [Fusarium sarcochroum]
MSWNPCAATASLFLFARGALIKCCHHDTLAIQRTLRGHTDDVQLLVVDDQSGPGAGRYAASYDAGHKIIVWDLCTGKEKARLKADGRLTAAAWMANGNIAFGDAKGRILLFEPSTSGYTVFSTINNAALTALAPLPDCATFALGYSDGSLSIATLLPRTILHNLTTDESSLPLAGLTPSERPSPIVSLAWHTSSLRQDFKTLAVQKHDGCLRLWRVPPRQGTDERPRVIRDLMKDKMPVQGPRGMGWAKGSCIVKYSNTQIHFWDVNTESVICHRIQTPESVCGMALYGPGSTLFTLGANNTVQQSYLSLRLHSSNFVVASVQHPPNPLPPLSPILWRAGDQSATSAGTIVLCMQVSESDAYAVSSLSNVIGPQTCGSNNESRHSTSPAPRLFPRALMRPSTIGCDNVDTMPGAGRVPLPGSLLESTSASSMISRCSRNEASQSQNAPSNLDENTVQDLFKLTRARLDEVLNTRTVTTRIGSPTNDDVFCQMFDNILEWEGDVNDFIRHEMNGHPKGSPSYILLARWLGDTDITFPNRNSEQMSGSDWMLLALSGIGTVGHDEAIKFYISHKHYLEALILTRLASPSDLRRQAEIVRYWGRWAALHGQQRLADRCSACIERKHDELPESAQFNLYAADDSNHQISSPPFSHSGTQRDRQRSIAKTSALKLITSFADDTEGHAFFVGDEKKAPIATRKPVSPRVFGKRTTTAVMSLDKVVLAEYLAMSKLYLIATPPRVTTTPQR